MNEVVAEHAKNSDIEVPEDSLIVVPVRNLVLFPGIVTPIAIGRAVSVSAAQEAVRSGRKVGVLLQRDPSTEEPGPADMYRFGTMGSILRLVTAREGTHHLIVQGERRFRVQRFDEGFPFLLAQVEVIPEDEIDDAELEARLRILKSRATEAVELLPQAPAELLQVIENTPSASALADLVAHFLDLRPDEKQNLLEIVDLRERIARVSEQLAHRIEVLRLTREIDQQTKESMDERQREYILREQMKTIQKELGEGEREEIAELSEQIAKAKMPEEAEKESRRELRRLEKMPDGATEASMIRTWIEVMVDLPWSRFSEETIDLERAREVLDADHYGLEKIKKRLIEFLAVRKLNPDGKSPILCFVGPPGVGKTSLGQSIARALGLEFTRVSLGGVHDEAEIRGHRRTYIGSMPGNIVQALRKAGTRNPVLMLDEMDKLGRGVHGDPSAAMLEVLDPEQNHSFRDNYLGVPFDLSRVLFVGTANVLENIPGPLRDRMEIIELAGYTEEEKFEIARRYLVERQRKQAGLGEEQIKISDDAIHAVIRSYTREAGVRNLERRIGAIMRHAAVEIGSARSSTLSVKADDLGEILGPQKFENEVAMRTAVAGVATGLAWTPVGGDILFIEASRVGGSGRLILTGQLGDVMKESAQAALSLVKARTEQLGIDPAIFEKSDIHVHVPAGAIPKDGPSAGVAMFLALASALSGKLPIEGVAMTGEISLRGLVLPVGGIKEKLLAAERAGIRKVLLPRRNEKDLVDLPESTREALDIVLLEDLDQALREGLSG